jgi:two-component system sensor histidine kinase/response regulator
MLRRFSRLFFSNTKTKYAFTFQTFCKSLLPKLCITGFWLFLILPCYQSQAQPNVMKHRQQVNAFLDSMETGLMTEKNDSLKMKIYRQLCFGYRNENKDKSLFYGNKGLELARKQQNKKAETDFLRFIGITYWQHFYHELALEKYYQALEIAENINYEVAMGFTYDVLGSAFTDKHEYKQALIYTKKAANIFEKLQHPEGLGYAHTHLSNIYTHQQDYTNAIHHAKKALAIREQSKDTVRISNTLRDIGLIYIQKKEYQTALNYFEKALFFAQKVNNLYTISECEQRMAEANLLLGNTETALHLALQSIEIGKKYDSYQHMIRNSAVLSKIYAQKQDYQKAFQYKEMYHKYQDSVLSQESRTKMLSDNIRYEFEKKQQKLVIETEKQQLILKKQQYVIIMAVISLLATFVTVYVIYRKSREQQKAKEILIETNNELQQVMEELQAQTEHLQQSNEFKDKLFSVIGHDLRSPLVGVNGVFELKEEGIISEQEFATLLPNIAQNIYQVTHLTENILFWAKSQIQQQGLRKEVVDLHLLTKNQMDMLAVQANKKKLILKNEIAPRTLAEIDKNMIDFVIRNLISNAMKFSYPNQTISVTAIAKAEKIELCFTDTGVGIDEEDINTLFSEEVVSKQGTANEKGTGLGLQLCKEFVQRNGGKIWLKSKPNVETQFFFTVNKVV